MSNTMTAAQAKEFEAYSANNAEEAETRFNERFECKCEAYEDIFTFNRWKAQKYCVSKGEKGIKLSGMKSGVKKDKETGEEKKIKYSFNYTVFCRCQVKKQ